MSMLIKNTFLLTFASIGQKAVAFLYFAFIARQIGDERLLGAYFLALVLTTTVGVFDDAGLTSVVIRDTAKDSSGAVKLLKNVLAWKLCLVPFTMLAACFLAPVLHFSTEATGLVYVAIFVMAADTFSATFYGVLRGLHTVKYEAFGVLLGQLFTATIGVVSLVSGAFDLRFLVVALLVGSAWNAVFSAVQVGRKLGFGALVPSMNMGLQPLRLGLMFFLAAVFVKIYSYIDSFTIKMVLGEAAVGVYSIAYKFAYAFQFLPLAFVGALYPAMSSQLHDKHRLKQTLLQAEWYLALLAAPIVFGLAALAPEVIEFVYGERYVVAAPALRALLVGLWFIFMDFPMGSLLNASGMQHKKTFAMGIAMVINFIANLIFVRMFGITGAGYAAILTFITLFAVGFFFVRQIFSLKLSEWWGSVGGITFAGMGMCFVVLLVKIPLEHIHALAWVLSIPFGGVVFLLLGWKSGGITPEHVAFIKSVLRRKKYVADSSANA